MSGSELGPRIRATRQAAGLTQDALAIMVGVSRSAVAQWETGRAGQVSGNLARIAKALSVPEEYLLTGVHPKEPPKADETEMLQLYLACNSDDRVLLLRSARRLARAT